MRDIDRTLLLLINQITKDRLDINFEEVVKSWREYISFWPDDARAMEHLQKVLLKQCMDEHGADCIIMFGQYMENLGWSFRKKNEVIHKRNHADPGC